MYWCWPLIRAKRAAVDGQVAAVDRAANAKPRRRSAAVGPARQPAAVIDDVALAKALKASGSAIWIGLADEVCSVRPYPELADLWDMVARSAYTQLGFSVPLLMGTIAGLAVTFLGPIAAVIGGLVVGSPLVGLIGIVALLAMELSYLPMIRYHHLGSWRALGLPVAACMYGAMTVTSARRHYRTGVAWKGRRYGALTE